MRRVGEVIYTILYCPAARYGTNDEIWIDLLSDSLKTFEQYQKWADALNRNDQHHKYRAAKVWLLEVL